MTGVTQRETTLCQEWLSLQLEKGGFSRCDNLATHFVDGVALADLLQVLTGKRPKVKKNAKIKALQMDNINQCIAAVGALPDWGKVTLQYRCCLFSAIMNYF